MQEWAVQAVLRCQEIPRRRAPSHLVAPAGNSGENTRGSVGERASHPREAREESRHVFSGTKLANEKTEANWDCRYVRYSGTGRKGVPFARKFCFDCTIPDRSKNEDGSRFGPSPRCSPELLVKFLIPCARLESRFVLAKRSLESVTAGSGPAHAGSNKRHLCPLPSACGCFLRETLN